MCIMCMCIFLIGILLTNALQEGSSITTRWTKLSLSGPPASGKTSILKLLLNEDPPDKHDSTPVATASEVRMTTVVTGIEESTHHWEKVDYDTLKKKIAETIKSHIKHTAAENIYLPSTEAFIDVQEELNINVQDGLSYDVSRPIHWIYAVDTGGQAAFLDIAPALLRYTSVNILTHRLHEKLSDETCFIYSVKGKQIGLPIKRKLTHQQVLERSMRSLASLQPPQFQHIKVSSESKEGSDFLVLGTFYDKYKLSNEESLHDKEKILDSTLSHFNDVILKYGSSIIFPVDTTARGDDELKIANAIRRKVSKSYTEADIPARWFLFQLELLRLRDSGRQIVTLSICCKTGISCNMNNEEVKAALVYFHDLTVILYFPHVLKNVVFLHPQPLFDKLSEIVSVSFADSLDHFEEMGIDLPPGAHESLKTNGIFTRALLNVFPQGFLKDEYTPDDFLKLMKSLFIIAKLPNEIGYFIPCVLPSSDEVENLKSPYMTHIDPLVLTWNVPQDTKPKPVPQGLLPALVVTLLHRQNSPVFSLPASDSSQYRNAVRLPCTKLGGGILLVDSVYHLYIYYSGKADGCFAIRNAIIDGISQVFEKFSYNPNRLTYTEVFFCPTHDGCFCSVDDDRTILTCWKDHSVIPLCRQRKLPWFDDCKKCGIGKWIMLLYVK